MRPVLYPKAYRGLTVMIVALICQIINALAVLALGLLNSYYGAEARDVILFFFNVIPEAILLIGLSVAKKSSLTSFVQAQKLYSLYFLVHTLLSVAMIGLFLFLAAEIYIIILNAFNLIVPFWLVLVYMLVLKGCAEGTDGEIPNSMDKSRLGFLILTTINAIGGCLAFYFVMAGSWVTMGLSFVTDIVALLLIINLLVILIKTKKIMYR